MLAVTTSLTGLWTGLLVVVVGGGLSEILRRIAKRQADAVMAKIHADKALNGRLDKIDSRLDKMSDGLVSSNDRFDRLQWSHPELFTFDPTEGERRR